MKSLSNLGVLCFGLLVASGLLFSTLHTLPPSFIWWFGFGTGFALGMVFTFFFARVWNQRTVKPQTKTENIFWTIFSVVTIVILAISGGAFEYDPKSLLAQFATPIIPVLWLTVMSYMTIWILINDTEKINDTPNNSTASNKQFHHLHYSKESSILFQSSETTKVYKKSEERNKKRTVRVLILVFSYGFIMLIGGIAGSLTVTPLLYDLVFGLNIANQGDVNFLGILALPFFLIGLVSGWSLSAIAWFILVYFAFHSSEIAMIAKSRYAMPPLKWFFQKFFEANN
ncbi:MAG: hypothetical protein HC828_03710 [Blastochloris sp.]|nr:hypothetical protein [Blastochloris sp.]